MAPCAKMTFRNGVLKSGLSICHKGRNHKISIKNTDRLDKNENYINLSLIIAR